MLVLQTEIIPNEATENLQGTEYGHHYVAFNIARLDETHGQGPAEAQY